MSFVAEIDDLDKQIITAEAEYVFAALLGTVVRLLTLQ
jgi:hypothetical protein